MQQSTRSQKVSGKTSSLGDMEIFAQFVTAGRRVAAADKVKIAVAAVSKPHSAARRRLAPELSNKPTRRLTPTEEGSD